MVVVGIVAYFIAPQAPAMVKAYGAYVGAVTAAQPAKAYCDLSVKTPDGLSINAGTLDLLIVGTEIQNETAITFDCWKPVLRDTSTTPSSGKMMKEIMEDPRIKQVAVKEGEDENRPDVRLVNIWGDQFDIEYVVLPTGHLAMHATPAV